MASLATRAIHIFDNIFFQMRAQSIFFKRPSFYINGFLYIKKMYASFHRTLIFDRAPLVVKIDDGIFFFFQDGFALFHTLTNDNGKSIIDTAHVDIQCINSYFQYLIGWNQSGDPQKRITLQQMVIDDTNRIFSSPLQKTAITEIHTIACPTY